MLFIDKIIEECMIMHVSAVVSDRMTWIKYKFKKSSFKKIEKSKD